MHAKHARVLLAASLALLSQGCAVHSTLVLEMKGTTPPDEDGRWYRSEIVVAFDTDQEPTLGNFTLFDGQVRRWDVYGPGFDAAFMDFQGPEREPSVLDPRTPGLRVPGARDVRIGYAPWSRSLSVQATGLLPQENASTWFRFAILEIPRSETWRQVMPELPPDRSVYDSLASNTVKMQMTISDHDSGLSLDARQMFTPPTPEHARGSVEWSMRLERTLAFRRR